MTASDSESRLEVASSRIENARVGQNGAGDGKALALAAAEFYAALADDGFVAFGKTLGELIDTRDAARLKDPLPGGVRTREGDILVDRSVEEKRVLQHHSKLVAIALQPHRGEIHAIDEYLTALRRMKGRQKRDDGRFA